MTVNQISVRLKIAPNKQFETTTSVNLLLLSIRAWISIRMIASLFAFVALVGFQSISLRAVNKKDLKKLRVMRNQGINYLTFTDSFHTEQDNWLASVVYTAQNRNDWVSLQSWFEHVQ